MGSGWSDCAPRSPWLELHTLNTYTHRDGQLEKQLLPPPSSLLPPPSPLAVLPADEGLDALPPERVHGHGHGLGRGQPVGVVVPGGEVADVVDVAEHEGHGAEPAETAACRAWRTDKRTRETIRP